MVHIPPEANELSDHICIHSLYKREAWRVKVLNCIQLSKLKSNQQIHRLLPLGGLLGPKAPFINLELEKMF